MARTFGKYSPSVPLGTTWEESLVLEDEDGVAVDLTGYDVVAQFFAVVPTRDELGGPATDPLLEVTTSGYRGSPPDYSVEGFTVPTPANGEIVLTLPPADFWVLSPTNAKAKLYWSILLVNDSGYTIPVVSGRVTLTPNNTILT